MVGDVGVRGPLRQIVGVLVTRVFAMNRQQTVWQGLRRV